MGNDWYDRVRFRRRHQEALMPTRRTLLRGTAAAALATTAPVRPASPVDPRALRAALDEVVATGATAALARLEDRAGTWTGSSGVAELGRTRPPSPAGRFRVGSITKTFVSTVVLQLVAERRLGLDDPVTRWLPGLIPGGAQITLHNLLQHTSGLYNYTDTLFSSVDAYLRIRYRSFTPNELVAIAAAEPPLFPPGTSWSYSNTNYIGLGLVVQRVTGRPYAAEVARRILRPLRMEHTELPGTALGIPGPHAHGYLPIQQGNQTVPLDITRLNPSAAWAAGEVISTTADLNRLYRAQLAGRLLPAPILREMLTPTGPIDYGLGIYRITLPDGTVL
jgi:D-alanyl-D-alanine carboxypeptidase